MDLRTVTCPKCGVQNRIREYSDRNSYICAKCGNLLIQQVTSSKENLPRQVVAFRSFFSLPYISLLIGISLGIVITPLLLTKDFASLAEEEAQTTDTLEKQHSEQLAVRRGEIEKELASIDRKELRRNAARQYLHELVDRNSYDKRFALTPREKAQLHMQSLASDSTKSFHEAMRAVAQEASPSGADISVRETPRGVSLHIDFDMSRMTHGEEGTRTKHHTIDSLRKEVIVVISRVTNDIFQFCKNFDLASIHVGCRHHVKMSEQEGSENILLYKIRIQKDRIPQFTSNPFLDVYSTSEYFEIDEDNFKDIEIETFEQ